MQEYPLNGDDYSQMLEQGEDAIRAQLTEYANVVTMIEGHFTRMQHETGEEVAEIQKKLEEHEARHGPVKNFEDSAWWAHLSALHGYIQDFEESFPCLARAGLFLALYGYVEYELDSLARAWSFQTRLSPADLRGNGIERTAAFFSKVMSISIPDSILQGPSYRLVNAIRNSLAHNSGFLKASEKVDSKKRFDHLRHECMLEEEVKIDKLGRLMLRREFFPWFIEKTERTFEQLFSALKEYVVKHSEEQ